MTELGAALKLVADDLQWLMTWLDSSTATEVAVRRGSGVLYRLLNGGLIRRAWQHLGLDRTPTIPGPNLLLLAQHQNVELDLAAFLIAGGATVGDIEIAFFGAFRADNPSTRVSARAEQGFAVQVQSISRIASEPPPEDKLTQLVRFPWSLNRYLSAPAAVRRGFLITRREILAHFRDSYGTPSDTSSRRKGARQIRRELIGGLEGRADVLGWDGLHFELLSIGQSIARSVDMNLLVSRLRQMEPTAGKPPAKHPKKLTVKLPHDAPASAAPDRPVWSDNIIGELNPATPVYRTFRIGYLYDALRANAMPLMSPRLWEDPRENIIAWFSLVELTEAGASQIIMENHRMPVFAQCWTRIAESDGLWRIYSRVEKDPKTNADLKSPFEGVRVRTTVGKLIDSLWRSSPTDPGGACFLGRVSYYPEDKALDLVARAVREFRELAFADGKGHAEALLIKRQEFAHEEEVRLIFVDQERKLSRDRLYYVAIDPNQLFDEITLDPRLLPGAVKDREHEIRQVGYAGPVNVSQLYQRVFYQVPGKGYTAPQ